MYRNILKCRACNYGEDNRAPGIKADAPKEKLTPVFDLGWQPLANSFRSYSEEQTGKAPLCVMLCPRCGLAQLSVVVSPEILYAKNYPYITSGSDTMRAHFDTLARDLANENGGPGSIIEIGSNNGALLKQFSGYGFTNGVGIDPAANLCKMAHEAGVLTFQGMFNDATAGPAQAAVGAAKYILARHIFCHVDDWQAFIASLANITDTDTLIAIEVPYIMDQMAALSFDQIYHEHLSYMSLRAMQALLAGTPLHMHKIIRYSIHGGAILIMLRHNSNSTPPDESVNRMLAFEACGLDQWIKFHKKSCVASTTLELYVRGARSTGKTVCAFGASAKSTVFMNWCGFTRNDIAFICDNTPGKQGKIVPGTDIPVLDEGALLREMPDCCILTAWNFKDEIIAKNELYRSKGGKFVVPIPKLEIV